MDDKGKKSMVEGTGSNLYPDLSPMQQQSTCASLQYSVGLKQPSKLALPKFTFPCIEDRKTPRAKTNKKRSPVSTILATPYENRFDALLLSASGVNKAQKRRFASSISPLQNKENLKIPKELLLPDEISLNAGICEDLPVLPPSKFRKRNSLLRSTPDFSDFPSFQIGTSEFRNSRSIEVPLPKYLPKPRFRSRRQVQPLLQRNDILKCQSNQILRSTNHKNEESKLFPDEDEIMPFLSLEQSLM